MQRFGLLCVSRCAVMLVGFAVAGCSSHGGALPSMPGGMPSSHLAQGKPDPRMAQVETSFVRQLRSRSVTHATLNGVALPKTYAVHRPTGFSSAAGNDFESLGFTISSGGTYTGLLAVHSAYRPNDFTVTFPSGSPSTTSFVLAPYGYPPNGSCYAVGSFYASTSSAISNAFLVQNMCSNSTVAYPINDAFRSAFVVPAADGTPSYYTVTFTTDAHPTSSSVWRTWLYDFPASQWVEVAETTGLGSSTSGGDGFIAQLAQGLCPNIPTVAASNLALFDASTQTFASLQPTMSGGVTSSFVSPGTASCFTDDGTHNGAVYQYGAVPNNEWIVQNKSGTQTQSIQQFPLPSCDLSPTNTCYYHTRTPDGIAAGPDGNLWFAELDANSIGRMTPAGTVTEWEIPTARGEPADIAAGPDGNLWFTESNSNKIGRITPSGAITEFTLSNYNPLAITAGPDGNLWFVGGGGYGYVGRITTAGVVTTWATPTSGSYPQDITAGPDGALWFTELGGNQLGRITTAGTITELASIWAPGGITTGRDGNLWVTDGGFQGGAPGIDQVTTGGAVTGYPTAGHSPGAITVGNDGNLWLTDGGSIGRFNYGGTITDYTIPANTQTNDIAAGPDGNLWVTEPGANTIGRMTP